MSEPANFTRAKFTPQSGSQKGQEIEVHFNPASLQLAITNSMKEEGEGNTKKQFVSQSTAKLTMDLIFDTTSDGQDVRTYTEKVARFMEPDEKKVPPVVKFEWGTYTFQGVVESYRETIDFFAPSGVPLRASINMTLSKQDKVFEPSTTSKVDTRGSLADEVVDVPSGEGSDATSIGALGGDPRAGRFIASANGLASMRFTAGASLSVGASVKLSPPVAFATGKAGGGIGIGGGIGVGGGIGIGGGIGGGIGIGGGVGVGGSLGIGGGIGAGGGVGIGASAGFGAGAGIGGSAGIASAGGALSVGGGAGLSAGASAGFGGAAGAGGRAGAAGAGLSVSIGSGSSARVSAKAGAFAGLRAQPARKRVASIDTKRLIRRSESAMVATDQGASFRVGGQANIEGSTSLSADVGASASLRSRIQFEED